mgnify:CR=1 FL=1
MADNDHVPVEADDAEADIVASQRRHSRLRAEIVAQRLAVQAAEARWREMEEENERRAQSVDLVADADAFMRALAA